MITLLIGFLVGWLVGCVWSRVECTALVCFLLCFGGFSVAELGIFFFWKDRSSNMLPKIPPGSQAQVIIIMRLSKKKKKETLGADFCMLREVFIPFHHSHTQLL